MKKTILFISAFVLSLFLTANSAQALILNCKSSVKSPVIYSVNIAAQTATIQFGKWQKDIESNLKNKSIGLRKDVEASTHGYVEYSGEIKLAGPFHQARTVKVRVAETELQKQSGAVMTMSPSEPYPQGMDGAIFAGYGMICSVPTI